MSLVDKLVRRIVISSMFGDGWGDQETFQKLLDLRTSYMYSRGISSLFTARTPHVQLTELKSSSKHVRTYLGQFESPLEREAPGLLPKESRNCRFHLVVPSDWEGVSERRVCLHYAATGDQTFWRRSRFLAQPLAKDYKIGSVVLENPFYGSRKPEKQVRAGIRQVSDLFTMGTALILEGGHIFAWLQQQGYTRLGISGVSLGGHNASLTSAVWGQPVATIPCLSWSTAAHSFSEGIFSGACSWSVLKGQLHEERDREIRDVIRKTDPEIQQMFQERYPNDTIPETLYNPAKRLSTLPSSSLLKLTNAGPDKITALYMRLLMDEFTNLKNYPVPACPEAAVLVVASDDLYVTRPENDEMIKDISEIWPGCEVRVVNGGHISSYLTHNHSFRKAIHDAFDKLDVYLERSSGDRVKHETDD